MEYKLILASASPRRHQLMCDAGFKFEVRLKHTEEIWPEGLAVGGSGISGWFESQSVRRGTERR